MTIAPRPTALQAVLDRLAEAFDAVDPDSASRAALNRVFEALQQQGAGRDTVPARLPACAAFAPALAELDRHGSAPLVALGRALAALEPHFTWRRRGGATPGASENFETGHANAMLVGPGGIESRSDVWVGVSLLEPHVRYPDHTHPPEEVYLVLSPGRFAQRGGPWFTPGIGGSFHNEPGILHAMASDDRPLLAVWCLFAGRPAADQIRSV